MALCEQQPQTSTHTESELSPFPALSGLSWEDKRRGGEEEVERERERKQRGLVHSWHDMSAWQIPTIETLSSTPPLH